MGSGHRRRPRRALLWARLERGPRWLQALALQALRVPQVLALQVLPQAQGSPVPLVPQPAATRRSWSAVPLPRRRRWRFSPWWIQWQADPQGLAMGSLLGRWPVTAPVLWRSGCDVVTL